MIKSRTNQILWATVALSLGAVLSPCQSLPKRSAIDLNSLQGYWEGEGAGGKCSITITNNNLHYRVGTNWHQATFTLPLGTNPQQLHATIKDSWPPAKDTIGQVVHAIIKIEDHTLTLATIDISQFPPQNFNDARDKYVVKHVQPKKENTQPPATNNPSTPKPRNT